MRTVLTAVVLLVCVCQGFGQPATGRSNTGPIVGPLKQKPVTDTATPSWPLRFDLEFTEPSGNSVLDPKERGRLRVVITNIGRAAVRGVSVRVTPVENAAGVVFNDLIAVGDIPSENVRYAFFYFTAGPKVVAPGAKFLVEVLDSNGAPIADSKNLVIQTQ